MCMSYKTGGYKIIDVITFISTLKISWLRRLNENNLRGSTSTWSDLYPPLLNLVKFGQEYIQPCLDNVKNPFWSDVLKHYKKLCKVKRNKPPVLLDVYEEPLHFNKNIKRSRKIIFDQEWDALGILNVKHVLNEDGKVLNYNEFRNKYNDVQTNARMFTGMSRAVNKYLENVKNNNSNVKNVLPHEVWACIGSGNRAVKDMFQNEKDLPTASKKWNSEFENLNWKFIFKKCMKNSPDPQLQWFQARLLHRILPTQKYLTLCKLTDSSFCVFCGNSIENLNHLFWNCNFVKKFWNDFMKLLHEKCTHCDRLNLCQELVIFGIVDNIYTDEAIDSLILYAKYFIYKCKLQDIKPEN